MLEELLKALNANTAELQRNTAITEKLAALRADAIETVKTEASKTEAPKTTKPKADSPKTTAKVEDAPKEEKPAASNVPASMTLEQIAQIASGEVVATDDMMRALGATFVTYGGTEEKPVDGDERKARMVKVKTLLANEKVAAASLAETKPNVRKAVAKKFVEWITELTPPPADEDDAGEIDL